jgi:hypothetical protein
MLTYTFSYSPRESCLIIYFGIVIRGTCMYSYCKTLIRIYCFSKTVTHYFAHGRQVRFWKVFFSALSESCITLHIILPVEDKFGSESFFFSAFWKLYYTAWPNHGLVFLKAHGLMGLRIGLPGPVSQTKFYMEVPTSTGGSLSIEVKGPCLLCQGSGSD